MHERGLHISIAADIGPSAAVKIGPNDTNLADLVEWRIWIAPEKVEEVPAPENAWSADWHVRMMDRGKIASFRVTSPAAP